MGFDLQPPWLLRKSLLNAARARLARGLLKKSPIKCSTCKTSQGVNLKENPFKIFPQLQFSKEIPLKFLPFHFFPREISCKKFITHLQFYVKISNKNLSSFFTGKSLYNLSKKLLLRIFFKISLQEGDFENSLKFLQLVQNLTPIRKLLCTFLYQCSYYPRPPLQHI